MIKKQNPLGRILFILGALSWIQMSAVFLPAQSNEPIDRMQASTVLVVVKAGNQYGSGSGFVVGNGKYVVTNWHVIRVAAGIVVLAGREKTRAVVKRQSERKDLAILELETRVSRPDVTFAPRSLLKKAQIVYAMGFPSAAMDANVDADSSIAEVKISKGIISAFVKSRTGTALLQTDAAINPGNSGGPLFNTCGHVVGINDMKALTQVIAADGRVVRVPEGEGVGWAIQTDELFQELDNAGISYKRASAPCRPQTGSTTAAAGRDPLVLVGILAAILLGVIAVVLALTKQGRQVVKNVKNTFSKGISREQPTPKPGPPPPPGKKLKPLLRGTAGQYRGMEIELDDDPLAIGRDPGMSQLVLTEGRGWEEVSGRHCTITYNFEKKCFFLEDHWSSNGTYLLSGKQVKPGTPVPLKSGERFYLSGKDVMFEVIMEE